VSEGQFWIVGCGNMAGAMLSRWLATGMEPSGFHVIDPARPALPAGVELHDRVPDGTGRASRLLLGVKPQQLATVAPEIQSLVGEETTLLSILAGIDCTTLRSTFPDAGSIVRVMPNLPVALGKGVVALHAEDGPVAGVGTLMAPLGSVEWFPREELFALVTALSGSGPAFLYRFVDALASAATELGMPSEQAARIALATVEGASALAASADASPGELASRVASKGGSTRAGLDMLDAGNALNLLILRTLEAARNRNVELGRLVPPGR
jgi:pyrroline-5-carboxylate reductase